MGLKQVFGEVDQLEAFDAIAKILEPIGLKPFNGYSAVTFERGQMNTTVYYRLRSRLDRYSSCLQL